MKQFVLLAVIAGLLALSNGAALQSSDTELIVVTTDGISNGDGLLRQYSNPAAALLRSFGERRLLTQGTIGPADQRIYGMVLEWDNPNLIHIDLRYDGSIPITGIQVTELSGNPHTTAAIIGGGLGQVHTTVRIAAPGSNSFLVQIDIWG